jgi:hypothetical protein
MPHRRAGDRIVVWRRQPTAPPTPPVADWITHEFACRGLVPPHCTPEALARALERERGIRILFVPDDIDEPGVTGMVCRHKTYANTYSIVFRPTSNLALRRLIWFHELAHLLFHDLATDAGEGDDAQRGPMVKNTTEARAEMFAVGAMQYSFGAEDPLSLADQAGDVTVSAFGHYLQRTAYWP